VRWLALVGSIIGFIATLPLVISFDIANPGMQFVKKSSWIPTLRYQLFLGIDGISVWFIVLTAFINSFCGVIAAWEVIDTKVSQYMASFMIFLGLMIGVFAALDALLLMSSSRQHSFRCTV
jgi:NADH-quinone oxidoreductase subunit M